jgi:hypothetical protein
MNEQVQGQVGDGKVEQAAQGTPAAPLRFTRPKGMSAARYAAYEAFYRDLPELAKTHRGLWVAYTGDRRVGFGKDSTELYQRCLAQGLKRGDFLVQKVEPINYEVGPEGDVEVG